MIDNNKLHLLISIAKLYYLENMNQNEIASLLGVSRPLISKYLMEARNLGVVKIEINDLLANNNTEDYLTKKNCDRYNLKELHIIPSSSNKDLNDQMFADHATEFILEKISNNFRLGIGWGSAVEDIIKRIKREVPKKKFAGDVIPLISNAPISYRNYHTNELVRMLADESGLNAKYLYAPVICSTPSEQEIFLNTDNVKGIMEQYNHLDYAIIQIRNFPSVPDLASEARFGKKLREEKAVGMILAYYYDIDGKIIKSETDYSIQIPIESLKKTKRVIGIVNARVNARSIIGALNLGIFTDIIISDNVSKEIF